MNTFHSAAMLLALASASFAQEADWLWQFVDDEEKDGPQIQQQIRRGAKEIARLLHETGGEGEGEGDDGSDDTTPSTPTPAVVQPTPSPPTPAAVQPTPVPPTPAEQTTTSPTPEAATPAPPPLAQPTPSPTAAEDGTGITTTTTVTTTSQDLIDAADRTNPVTWTLFAMQITMALVSAVAA